MPAQSLQSCSALPVGVSRQERWSRLPCPLPGDLPDPGIKPASPALQADSLPTEQLGNPLLGHSQLINSVLIVGGEQQRDSAIYIHVSIFPQTPLPSRLPHNIEEVHVLCSRSLLVIHFKGSSVYMSRNEFIFNSHLVISTCIWTALCFYTVRYVTLGVRKLWPMGQSHPLRVFINKTLLKHSHGCFFCGCFVLQWQSWEVAAKTVWSAKPKIFIYKRSLPIPDLKHKKWFSLLCWETYLFIFIFIFIFKLVIMSVYPQGGFELLQL